MLRVMTNQQSKSKRTELISKKYEYVPTINKVECIFCHQTEANADLYKKRGRQTLSIWHCAACRRTWINED